MLNNYKQRRVFSVNTPGWQDGISYAALVWYKWLQLLAKRVKVYEVLYVQLKERSRTNCVLNIQQDQHQWESILVIEEWQNLVEENRTVWCMLIQECKGVKNKLLCFWHSGLFIIVVNYGTVFSIYKSHVTCSLLVKYILILQLKSANVFLSCLKLPHCSTVVIF